jgi:hypothetical protein
MSKERAGFIKAAKVFARAVQGHPLGTWARGVARAYAADLDSCPTLFQFGGQLNRPFTRKRLIDIFLYTQYAHQPNATPNRKDDRAHQYRECLAAVGDRKALLTWLFLYALWECSLHMRNAGVPIANFYDRYCQAHPGACDVLESVAKDNPGIGKLEKREDREQRLFDASVARLATQLWEQGGRPAGGHAQFVAEARAQLTAAMTDKSDVRGTA